MDNASAGPPVGPDAPTLTQGAAAWSALCAKTAQRARLDAEIVELTGVVQRSGTIEIIEGVTLDTALTLVHRMPGPDRSMQITAADVLADMPATMGLFKAGELSWGQVRQVVVHVRRLSSQARVVIDAIIDASRDRLTKMDPDDFIDQVGVEVQALRDAAAVERKERAVARRNFVWAQPSMDGAGKLYGELDNASLATVVTGMDAHAPGDDGRSTSQRRADGLVAMAAHRCPEDARAIDHLDDDPDDDSGTAPSMRPTRHRRLDRALPAFDVSVNLADASLTAAGTIQIAANGCLPTITAAAAEALAGDAQIRAILMDGGRPIAVTKKVWAARLPDDVRRAVTVRDRGDRFPGSRRPIEHVHHLDKRGKGHHVDHLVGLANSSHKRVHRLGWKVEVNPATAEVTFTRGERTWTTLPRGTRLRHPKPSP